MYSPIKSQRLYEQVVSRIELLITSGELERGDQLPNERNLAEQFGVSRTVVREALKTLVNKGLVEVRTGQGSFVVDGTSNALKQSLHMIMSFGGMQDPTAALVEIREILEPEIAYRAALRAEPEHIASLEKAVATMDEVMNSNDAFIQADNAFHLTLAVATQNAFIPRLLDSIVDVLHELRGQIFEVEGGPERGQHHHKRILQAIVDHAPEAAREAMRAHLAQVHQDSQRAKKLAAQAADNDRNPKGDSGE
jgi:GntR family transcriptional repressor for pyruvate dehydrogenase complex